MNNQGGVRRTICGGGVGGGVAGGGGGGAAGGPLEFLGTVQESDLGVPGVEQVVDERGGACIEVARVVYGGDFGGGADAGDFAGLGRRELGSRLNFVSLMVGVIAAEWAGAACRCGAGWARAAAGYPEPGADEMAGGGGGGGGGGVGVAGDVVCGAGGADGGSAGCEDSNRSAGLLAGTFGEWRGWRFRWWRWR